MEFLSLCVDSINIKGNCLQFVRSALFCSFLLFISVTSLVLSGDTEANPGPDPDYSNIFFFCHWKLNSIAARNFINTLMHSVPKWSHTP